MKSQRKQLVLNEPKAKMGRPEGALSKLSREAREQAKLTGQLPHEFLLSVARGEPIYRTTEVNGKQVKVLETYDFDKRIDAAKACAPYFAPKISTVEVISGVPDAELDLIIAKLASEAGLNTSASGEDTQDEG